MEGHVSEWNGISPFLLYDVGRYSEEKRKQKFTFEQFDVELHMSGRKMKKGAEMKCLHAVPP